MSRRRKNKLVTAPQSQQSLQGQPILAAAEQKVESQLTPDTRESYMKIVVAGMKAGLANGPNSILAGLTKSKDPISDCAKGAIGLVLILKHQAQGIMPVKAMIPAAMTLMIKALAFADHTGIVKVDANALARATLIFKDGFLAKYGITPPMVQTALGKVHGLTQDPVAMEQMKRSAGLVRHPDASEPTPLPEGP